MQAKISTVKIHHTLTHPQAHFLYYTELSIFQTQMQAHINITKSAGSMSQWGMLNSSKMFLYSSAAFKAELKRRSTMGITHRNGI